MTQYQLGQFVVSSYYLQREGFWHYALLLDGGVVHETSKHQGFESRGGMESDIQAQIRNMEQES